MGDKQMNRLGLAVPITFVAVLAVGAVAVARGGSGVYSGPIAQPPLCSGQAPPSIQLTVQARHAAVTITRANLFNDYYHCQSGDNLATGNGTGSLCKNVLVNIKVKPRQRTFKSTQGFEVGHLFITLTGKLLRNGSARGAVRFYAADGGTADLGDGQVVQLGHCDSGTLTWSATRQ